jgi:hypothetical protein
MRTFFLIVLTFVIASLSHAQPFQRQVEGIPVQANGAAVALPFAGGVNSPNHQFVDIDGDGDLDLFVLDVDPPVEFYRNEGTRFTPQFKLRNGVVPLPPITRWFLFHDVDGDGLKDLLTEDSTYVGVRLYKNTGTPQSPFFTLIAGTLRDSSNSDVFAGQNSIPAFVDIDADGDLDFFSSNYSGTINFYQNIGTPADMLLAFRTTFWQGITIYGDTCTIGDRPTNPHGASAFRFADINGNAAPDLFVGDVFASGVFYLQNIGTPSVPHMVCSTSNFPTNQPIRTAGFNQTSFVDIDSDGDLDLFVGVLATLVQTDGFWFYRNNGSTTSPLFQLETKNFLSMIDVGMNAHPAFVDIDANGTLDLFIGDLGGKLTFFKNEGTPSAPSFRLVDSVYQGIGGGFSFAPVFVDIDNNGTKDLFLGMYDGRMKFYRNVGTPQAAIFVRQSSPVDTINVASNAAPAFVDIDADGDLDLFVGKGNGSISFYRNDGNAAVFLPVLQTTAYQGIPAGLNLFPTFADIDNDGDPDLFIGRSEGRVDFYENIGTPTAAQFIRRTNHYADTEPLLEAAPALCDIDADGDKDLFIGTVRGGLHFYRNQLNSSSASEAEVPLTAELLQNYPNPFNPKTILTYRIPEVSHVTISVFDIFGRLVKTLVDDTRSRASYQVEWDATNSEGVTVAGGVYFARMISAGRSGRTLHTTVKMIYLK